MFLGKGHMSYDRWMGCRVFKQDFYETRGRVHREPLIDHE